ncbi:MAG: DUF2336 domain-containing protein [Caulobacter sp.]
MMGAGARLRELIDLAHEDSSDRRRDLLRGITDAFFSRDLHGAPEMALFDDVLSQLASEMETAVRADLAARMADRQDAPTGLLRRLAHDDITVAAPVLRRSASLSEDDLMSVARSRGQGHLQAISGRAHVPQAVSDVIVDRGDDETLTVLVGNEGAQLSRSAHEKVVDRAAASPRLQEAVVNRRALPVDLLNEMYFVVEARLRQQIMARNAQIDPNDLEAALKRGRLNVAIADGALPDDYSEAERAVREMKSRGELGPRVLAGMLRARQSTRFLVALAELSGVDFHTARRIVERRELDALAIICKAASFEPSLFLTFAVLILDRDEDVMGKARSYGQLYAELPAEVAQRTLRFWRMRRQTGDVAAA